MRVALYKRAFKQLRGQLPALDYYVYRDWQTDQILPWSHIKGSLPQATLIKHLDDATSHFQQDKELQAVT